MRYSAFIFSLTILSSSVAADSIFSTVASKSEYLATDSDTKFEYLGALSSEYKIYNYTRYFNGGLRAANRIVVIDSENNLAGIYSINDWAVELTGNCIIFPYESDVGNSICLIDGELPKHAWLDGENPELFK